MEEREHRKDLEATEQKEQQRNGGETPPTWLKDKIRGRFGQTMSVGRNEW